MATIKTFNAIDRIGQITEGFQKGVQNFSQGQEQQRQMTIQDEAKRRQQALQGLEVEAKLSESTGRNFFGSGVGEQVLSGQAPQLSELLKSTPKTQKFELEERKLQRQLERENLQDEKTRAELAELQKPFEQSRDFKKAEALAKVKNQNTLPLENKTIVQTLAKKNADAEYIANQIESFLEKSKSYNENQIFTQGNQLIKTLNSTISSDAAGAEEVKRLAGKLNFAMGNFTNDNPTQFGRDLPGFLQQARDTANIMRGGIDMNRKEIERASGRAQPSSSREPSAPGGASEGPWAKYGKR